MITLEQVRRAVHRIKPFVSQTPCEELGSNQICLKREDLQAAGSFKVRGVINLILEELESTKINGIIAHSSGNHGIAVAHVSKLLEIPCKILMPFNASDFKVQRCKSYGAEVQVIDGSLDDLNHIAAGMATEFQLTHVPPYDHESIIIGHATLALEILVQAPNAKFIIVPCGGGALLAAISLMYRELSPMTKVVGVEPILGNDVHLSLLAGSIVALPFTQTSRSVADGLRATKPGLIPFEYISVFTHDVLCVGEDAIVDAMEEATELTGKKIEPSGAIGLAVVQKYCSDGQTVVIVTGSNM